MQNTRMQATVRQGLVNGYKHQLEEGSAITLQRYSLGEIQPKYRIVKKPLRLSFLSNTVIEKCPDYNGSLYGFEFRPFRSITDLKTEEDGQFGMYHIFICKKNFIETVMSLSYTIFCRRDRSSSCLRRLGQLR